MDKDGIGERKTAEQVMSEIEKEVIFYDESGGGVTFSGGEPMMQAKFLEALLDSCKEREIHTALDTTGCVPPRTFSLLADKADLFLYDLKIIDNSLHKKYTGTSNQYVLENLKSLAVMKKRVIIRFPLIPGVTDSQENLEAVGEFISKLEGIRDIEVLPYHQTASQKYRRLNLKYKMKGVQPPGAGRILEVKEVFKSYGLNAV
jgi:pyruvate formate lyase activating enzyme